MDEWRLSSMNLKERKLLYICRWKINNFRVAITVVLCHYFVAVRDLLAWSSLGGGKSPRPGRWLVESTYRWAKGKRQYTSNISGWTTLGEEVARPRRLALKVVAKGNMVCKNTQDIDTRKIKRNVQWWCFRPLHKYCCVNALDIVRKPLQVYRWRTLWTWPVIWYRRYEIVKGKGAFFIIDVQNKGLYSSLIQVALSLAWKNGHR